MVVLPDLFAENTDADNEHLPANSVCFLLLIQYLNQYQFNFNSTVNVFLVQKCSIK